MVSTQTAGGRPAADPAPRFRGLLPRRMLAPRAPRWWQEVAIIAVGYWLYTLGRNAIPQERRVALRHAHDVAGLQSVLRLNFERSFNHLVATHAWLAQPLDYYYATLHFLVTPGVMIWLFLRHAPVYRGARTVLVTTTLLGLLGFYLYPTAPPRLLPGYVDTVIRFHTWGSFADPNIAEHSNQYAAMPSLHIAWALWCGLGVFACARRRWVRILGLLYPCGTFVVIIGTANHFVLDAVGGALLLGLGFAVQYAMSGHGAYTPPSDAARP